MLLRKLCIFILILCATNKYTSLCLCITSMALYTLFIDHARSHTMKHVFSAISRTKQCIDNITIVQHNSTEFVYVFESSIYVVKRECLQSGNRVLYGFSMNLDRQQLTKAVFDSVYLSLLVFSSVFFFFRSD